MFPRGRMVFPRAEPEGKPSSRGETFHHVTHTGMAYLFYYTEQTPFVIVYKARSQMTGDSHIPRQVSLVATGNMKPSLMASGNMMIVHC